MQELITEFIRNQALCTIACLNDAKEPHCFTAYYHFEASRHQLIFKSSGNTRHDKFLSANDLVSGSIHPNEVNALRILGLQFWARYHDPNDLMALMQATALFHTHHPASVFLPGVVRILDLTQVVYTDSQLGYGQRLVWESASS